MSVSRKAASFYNDPEVAIIHGQALASAGIHGQRQALARARTCYSACPAFRKATAAKTPPVARYPRAALACIRNAACGWYTGIIRGRRRRTIASNSAYSPKAWLSMVFQLHPATMVTGT